MNPVKTERLVLAGDIGGTKTNLGLFTAGKRAPLLKASETYPSRDAKDLEDLIKGFLERHPAAIRSACFGIAGPVIDGRCRATNLPWEVSEHRIKRRYRWDRVRLLNDLAATALAVPILDRRAFFPLNAARSKKNENMVIVAPGTGLGEAFLVVKDGHHIPVSSEGGHGDFAPRTGAEIELWRYLHLRWRHVSVERVLSGSGLVNIYEWLRDSGRCREPAYMGLLFEETDPARAISECAIKGKNSLCVTALHIFTSIFGAVAGNLALTGMARGGVYLGGGISPKILPKLKDGTFMEAFLDKGRFKDVMEKIPVRVILDDRAALLGAANEALKSLT
ncbi:MAG: glucokinase [Deltaproteobacteria bacterium]|nr:glucokinase [Deltaproteobacteria bacterium]